MAQFIGNILVRGKLECLTGLHIGQGKDTSQIGGVDSPVVRDPHSRQPYIPGSSLKGKMRSLLEFARGKVKDGRVHTCADGGCPVCRTFGSSAQEQRTCGPTRLLVRDAHADAATRDMWRKLDSELLYTEVKSENFLDRITSAANPRFIERVVKGSRFDIDLVYGVYHTDQHDDLDFFDQVVLALRLFEDSALGGSGSRGYGQIRLRFAPVVALHRTDYEQGTSRFESSRHRPADEECVLSSRDLALSRRDPNLAHWPEAQP
jgi:CRISPR-associated protein Csm3